MWAYQPHFRVSMEHRAHEVLKELGAKLEPKALLVGIRAPDSSGGLPECLEPEDEEWSPSLFFGCAKRCEEIYASHPDHKIFYGDEPSMRDKPVNIRKKAVLQSVDEILNKYDKGHDTQTFCGFPTRVANYYVVPALQFQRSQLAMYPRLPAPIRFREWVSVPSILQSLIEGLLNEASHALATKEPGRFLWPIDVEKVSLLRQAAARLCYAISLSVEDFMFQNIFDSLNAISSLRYEGNETHGEIVFASPKSPAIACKVNLIEPVSLRQERLARKILEMSSRDLVCLCPNSDGITGLVSIRLDMMGGLFRAVFFSHYRWGLYYGDLLLMTSSFGIPTLPSTPLKETDFISNIKRVLPGLSNPQCSKLLINVSAAMKQGRGTMIVVTDAAEQEARRLHTQSLPVAPIDLTPDIVLRVSGIDGAILVNRDSQCFAIGVILDGRATDAGDASRGARYNSAVRYVDSSSKRTICLVVSEDGHVDMIPNLRPQINRTEIENHINQLTKQTGGNYHKTRTWLDDHRFYLTAEQCDIVNRELARIDAEPLAGCKIKIVTPLFQPHSEMNESYYLDTSCG